MAKPEPKDIYPLHNFTGDFARWVKEGHDIRYCFVIGAGASRSSGIPTGASLVDTWLQARYEQDCPGAKAEGKQAWAEENFKAWGGFSWKNRAAFYGRIYQWYFRDPAAGQAELRQLMKGKSPSFGYSVLARILAKTNHKVVLTTNFDNLVRDAIHLHMADEDPFICHGEDDARFLSSHAPRIRIAKLHGDIDRKTYNAAVEIQKLNSVWDTTLHGIFTEYTPIFLGYGGNDPGVMEFLNQKLGKDHLRARPVWAYRVDSEKLGEDGSKDIPPGIPENSEIQTFMAKHQGLWLPIPGFDEFMLLLGHALEYGNQAPLIRGDADRRAKDYERTMSEAVRTLALIPYGKWCPQIKSLAAAAELKLLGEIKRRTWDEWRVALEAAPSRNEERRLLIEAVKELAESPELKAYYASFLAEEKPFAPEVDTLIQEATALAKKSAGEDSLAMLAVKYSWARILNLRGLSKDSKTIVEEVLIQRQKALGEDHPDTLKTLNLLAAAFFKLCEFKEAEQLLRRILEVRERTLGKEHPDTLGGLNNLASALDGQRQFKEGEQLHRRVLEVRERTLGKEHPDTLVTVNNLANALYSQKQFKEAEQLHRHVLEVRERTLGKEHPDTLGSVNNLANALSGQKQFKEAEQLYRRALEMMGRTLGKEHPDTLASVNNLALTLDSLGRSPEANELRLRFEK